jgi:hypothetical protein
MSHQQKHDARHEKLKHEREEREKQREEEWEKKPRTIHPGWLVSIGVVLIFFVVLTWMML